MNATRTHRRLDRVSTRATRANPSFSVLFFNYSELEELLPGILGQLGPEGMETLRKLAGSLNSGAAAGGDDDDVPELVENFDGSK